MEEEPIGYSDIQHYTFSEFQVRNYKENGIASIFLSQIEPSPSRECSIDVEPLNGVLQPSWAQIRKTPKEPQVIIASEDHLEDAPTTDAVYFDPSRKLKSLDVAVHFESQDSDYDDAKLELVYAGRV